MALKRFAMTNDFFYSVFDRQMEHLLSMSNILVEGWNDYAATELNCDLNSLRTKAARLCSLTDDDLVRQQDDLTQTRREENADYADKLHELIYGRLAPLLSQLVEGMRNRRLTEYPKQPTFPTKMDEMTQRLIPLLTQTNEQHTEWEKLSAKLHELEELIHKKVKPTQWPGMVMAERMHYLLQYFILMCYLLFHFQRMERMMEVEMTSKEAGRMLLNTIQQYRDSGIGREELERYRTTLLYDNDNEPLSLEQLKEARKALRREVPESLQMAFMKHIDDVVTLAQDIHNTSPSTEDFLAFVDVAARWQMLTNDIHAIQHPESIVTPIPNFIFNTVVHNQTVDLLLLREKLRRQIPLITRKNEWFCLWCVLRHRGLLKDESAEAFAQQMQMPEWLANDIPQRLTFCGDTLRTYSGYLNMVDFTRWCYEDFALMRTRQNKEKKWSDKLFKTFQHLCHKMNEGW